MDDKYDHAIDYLNRRPEEICDAWNGVEQHAAGCLFQYAGEKKDYRVGCLTQVKKGQSVAATPKLTEEIRHDTRLPAAPEDIKLHHLPVFAEWQRRIDALGVR